MSRKPSLKNSGLRFTKEPTGILRVWVLCCILGLSSTALSVSAQNSTAFPPATPESQGLSASALKELTDRVRGYFDRKEIAGAELLIIKNRKTVLHEALGWFDAEGGVPLKRNCIFNIRSMTKPVIGTAIQMLIDEGKLALQDPVHKFLLSFDTEKCRAITVEHLLTHRSGLPLGLLRFLREHKDIFAVAAQAADYGPQFTPGTGFQYSDPGSDSLGAVLAKASGQSIDAFLETRILQPLDMKDTITVLKKADPRRVRIPSLYNGAKNAWLRAWTNRGMPLYPFLYGAQGLYCSAMDYARFLALWMDNGRVGERQLLSPQAIRRGLTPVSKFDFPTGFPGHEVWYAQMWMLYIEPDASEGALPKVFSHGGSDGTLAYAWPELDLMVLYFTQSRGNETWIDFEEKIHSHLIAPLLSTAARKDREGKQKTD